MAAGTKDVTMKLAYETPEALPEGARTQSILEGENYILGKMYYDGTKNTYKMKRRQRTTKYGRAGEWYKSKDIERKGVDRLRKEWKDLNET